MNTWNTVILATGEETISNTNTTTGVQTRCLEVEGSPFDYDEKLASKMYEIVSRCYGTAGKEFINLLIREYSKEEYQILKTQLRQIQEQLEQNSNNDIMSYISAVSLVVLVDKIISKELFGEESEETSIQMGMEILENLSQAKDIDIVDKCYEYVKSWLFSNHKSFDRYKEPSKFENPKLNPEEDILESSSNSKSFGVYDNNVYYVHRAILEDKLKAQGYSYLKIVREFAKRGYTTATRDNAGNIAENTVQKKFRGKNARMFAFPIEPLEEPITEKEREKLEEEQQYTVLGTTKESIESLEV